MLCLLCGTKMQLVRIDPDPASRLMTDARRSGSKTRSLRLAAAA
jgi:hypothetical protein